MSAFYIVAYVAISLPAILAGVLVTPLGLDTTFEIFGASSRRWRWSSPSRRGARGRGPRPAWRVHRVEPA